MATIVRTYVHSESGHLVNVYESGAEFDTVTGRLVRGAESGVIRDGAKATEYHRRRREKTARLTRQKITAAMNAGLLPPGTLPVNDAAEATAEAAAVLWSDVVMNADAYPRDRVITFEKLTQLMGTDAADPTESAVGTATAAAAAGAAAVAAAAVVARVLADVMRVQAAAGQVIDADPVPPPPGDPVPLPPPQADGNQND